MLLLMPGGAVRGCPLKSNGKRLLGESMGGSIPGETNLRRTDATPVHLEERGLLRQVVTLTALVLMAVLIWRVMSGNGAPPSTILNINGILPVVVVGLMEREKLLQ